MAQEKIFVEGEKHSSEKKWRKRQIRARQRENIQFYVNQISAVKLNQTNESKKHLERILKLNLLVSRFHLIY